MKLLITCVVILVLYSLAGKEMLQSKSEIIRQFEAANDKHLQQLNVTEQLQ